MLAGWARTPARFREDANAEQDAALGGYADRLLVELAQNAADAAGTNPGRLLLRWSSEGLLAANTGHPLSAEGVLSLSTLRASAKPASGDERTVGRFGVGFAAVLSVTDGPAIGSRGTPSVRWSAVDSARAVADLPSITSDVSARGGHVPVLRLPFVDAPLEVPQDYDTVVWLPWRDQTAADGASRLLDELDPTLLLTLPNLRELRVERPSGVLVSTCVWTGADPLLDGRQWLGHEVTGPIPPDLLRDRPAEERDVRTYLTRAFVPADGAGLPAGVPRVLRAPTITDEPISLPAVVVATVPLEPTRRRVARGPLADLVLEGAGRCLAGLAARLDDPFPLVPTGLADGDVDAAARIAALAALRESPLLHGLVPSRCSYLDLGEATEPIADLLGNEVAGLLPSRWSAPSRGAAVGALGVRRIDTAGVVALLAGLQREPAFWRRAYGALAYAPDRDALAALPVPLIDGRVVTGARGALLPADDVPLSVTALPVRLVHPDAVHPLLERLGARPADAAALLTDPAVRQAVEVSVEDEHADDQLARAIVALIAESGISARDRPWLAGLALPAQGGGVEAAADLVWPGSAMQVLLDPEAGFRTLDPPAWLDRELAAKLGVADRPVVTRYVDVTLDVDADDETGFADLDRVEEWIDELAFSSPSIASAVVPEILAVRDLDAIADLAGLLALVPGDPELRGAIVEPVVIHGQRNRSYTAWWLSGRRVFGTSRPIDCVLPGIAVLRDLYDAAPGDLDADVLRALGVRQELAGIIERTTDLGDLFERLGDDRRDPRRDDVVEIHAAIAAVWRARGGEGPEPPDAVRAVRPDGAVEAVRADECVAVDAPDLISLVWAAGRSILLARLEDAEVLADLLEIDLASELSWPAMSGGMTMPVPGQLLALVPRAPSTYQLLEAGDLPWRWVGGTLYATEAGLAPGLAWAAGTWGRRHVLRIALERPGELARAVLEEDLAGGR